LKRTLLVAPRGLSSYAHAPSKARLHLNVIDVGAPDLVGAINREIEQKVKAYRRIMWAGKGGGEARICHQWAEALVADDEPVPPEMTSHLVSPC
jgi:hypothetical protein